MPRATSKQTVRRAKTLRGAMSLPEVLLWQRLRTGAVKFRRQHPIGSFVVDFYCPRAKLVIEIDGIAHDMGNRPTRDDDRDAFLSSRGCRVLRIAARDVLDDPDAVADALIRLCE